MRSTRMVLGCLMAVALCGCVGLTDAEKQGLTQFGTSTSSYADKVSTVTTAAQTDIIQMRLDELGFPTADAEKNFENVIKTDDSFEQYLESKPSEKPDEKKSPSSTKPEHANGKQSPSLSEHIAMMNGLASGLKDYGQALVDLANYGDPSGRLKTVQDIATNLDTVLQSPVAQAQATAISTAVGLVGNEIIEAVKKQDIKQTVKKFSPAVKSAVALLRAEFEGKLKGTLLWNYGKLIKTYADRLPDPTRGIAGEARLVAQMCLSQVKDEDPTSAKAAAYVAFCAAADTRRKIAEGRAKLLNMRARLAAMQKQGLDATNALEAANDKMVAALDNGSLSVTDILDFAKKTAAFAQAISKIK